MRKPLRLFIAVAEIGGGALLMIVAGLTAITQSRAPAWYLLSAESLGAVALLAGYWLIRNRSEGLSLSLIVQGSQIVQLFLPNLLYRVILGPYFVLVFSSEETLIAPGFLGEFTIGRTGPRPTAIGINVMAGVLFFVLARAILKQRRGLAPEIQS